MEIYVNILHSLTKHLVSDWINKFCPFCKLKKKQTGARGKGVRKLPKGETRTEPNKNRVNKRRAPAATSRPAVNNAALDLANLSSDRTSSNAAMNDIYNAALDLPSLSSDRTSGNAAMNDMSGWVPMAAHTHMMYDGVAGNAPHSLPEFCPGPPFSNPPIQYHVTTDDFATDCTFSNSPANFYTPTDDYDAADDVAFSEFIKQGHMLDPDAVSALEDMLIHDFVPTEHHHTAADSTQCETLSLDLTNDIEQKEKSMDDLINWDRCSAAED